jgi:hypothetical protein
MENLLVQLSILLNHLLFLAFSTYTQAHFGLQHKKFQAKVDIDLRFGIVCGLRHRCVKETF